MRPSKVLATVVGVILGLAAAGLIVGAAAILWAHGTQRDADGFYTSPIYELETDGYALTSGDIELADRPGEWLPEDLATVRVIAERAPESVFLGIGPTDDVEAYLDGVAQSEIIRIGPSSDEVDYADVAGSLSPMTPMDQNFWVASETGTDGTTLTWEVAAGDWMFVLMNADASADVAADVELAGRVPVLLAVAIGMAIFGVVIAAGAAALLVWATRGEEQLAAHAARPSAAYPATLEASLDPELSRWQWLVKWFLAIPHLVVLGFLWVAFVLLTVVAFFGILFTGRYPRSIFDFNVGVMRWNWRVSYYAFSGLGTDQYPPFTLANVDYPATFDVDYPEELSRGLALVKWWLLAIPHYIIVGLFASGLVWWTTEVGDGDGFLEAGGGLIGILVFVAAVILLFTGRYPQGIFDLVVGLNRWVYRVMAYASLMRDEYPPFRLDLGGEEPGADGPPRPSGSGDDDAVRMTAGSMS